MIVSKLRKIGKSMGFIINSNVLTLIDAKENDMFYLFVDNEGTIILKKNDLI